MTFQHQGRTFKLEFERRDRRTLARLVEVLEEGGLTAEAERTLTYASSTCSLADRFEKEAGRQHALRRLYQKVKGMNQEVAGKMMHTYFNRPRPVDPAGVLARIALLKTLLPAELRGEK